MKALPTRILLVEDDDDFALLAKEAIEETLGPLGVEHEIRRVTHLIDAINCVQVERWSIVYLDLSLPDCTGIETFNRLRGAAPVSLPIIALTGDDNEATISQALLRGAKEYLIKGQSYTHRGALARSLEHALIEDGNEEPDLNYIARGVLTLQAHTQQLLKSSADHGARIGTLEELVLSVRVSAKTVLWIAGTVTACAAAVLTARELWMLLSFLGQGAAYAMEALR